jgi:hypothetical protein
MPDFQEKVEYSFNDIQDLISNEIEESIHLDYKEANALDKTDGKKKEISKDVSAFANSDGGIIVYGLKELNHKAHSVTYIDGDIITKEWLEQTINSSIQRRISELKIYPVRNNGNIKETVYVVKIPKSYDTPHMCKDKRFYKRFNFESVAMEEYEIRQLYGQKLKSKLLIQGWNIARVESNKEGQVKINFEVSVYNQGEIPESDYKVNVYFVDYEKYASGFDWNTSLSQTDYTRMSDNKMKISSSGQAPIYSNETVNVIRFDIYIDETKLDIAREAKFEIKLLYSNGEDNMSGEFQGLIDKIIGKLSNLQTNIES